MSSESKPRPDSLLVELPRTLVPQLADPVAQARAELKAALAAIEEKANVSRRIALASDRALGNARLFARRNSSVAVSIVVGVASTVGLVVWAAARSLIVPGR